MTSRWLLPALLPALLTVSCRPATDDVPAAVIVLVLDGVRLQESFGEGASDAAETSHPSEVLPLTWEALVPKGVRANTALNIGATLTAPAHAAMVSGRRAPFGNYELAEEEVGLYRPFLPSIMEELRAQQGLEREHVALTGNTILIKPMSHSLWPTTGYELGSDFEMTYETSSSEDAAAGQPAQSDPVVFPELKERIQRDHPRFVMVNLHQADRDAHYGERPAYGEGVRELDEELAGFWDWIQGQPAYTDNTWLVIMADHGRHLAGGEEIPWSGHGDECWGCRNVPLLVLGPNVRAGQETNVPVLLTDLAPTFAALLDVELPWADGRVVDELFKSALDRSDRSGVAAIAASGGRVAEVRYLGRAERRKQLVVDASEALPTGVVLSSAEAFTVDAPAMVSTAERDWLCFRELVLDRGEDMPWVPRCFVDEGEGWEPIGSPQEQTGPFWFPTLVADGEGLVVLSPFNPFGVASYGTGPNTVGVRASRYQGGRWTSSTLTREFSFPGPVSAVMEETMLQVAFGAARGGVTARNERRLWSGRLEQPATVDWADEVQILNHEVLGEEPVRLERPALGMGSDGVLRMAAIAYTDELTRVVVYVRDGTDWVLEGFVEGSEGVMPHLSPAWAGDRVVFTAIDLETEAAEVCVSGAGQAASCEGLDASRVLDAVLDGETLHLVVDQGVGDWERVEVALP